MHLIKQVITVVGAIGLCASNAVAQYKPEPAGPMQILEDTYPYAAQAASDPELSAPTALNVLVPSIFTPLVPCRLADTRGTPGGPSPFGAPAGETVAFWAWGTDFSSFGGVAFDCGVSSTATAVHVNFTIVAPTTTGFLRTWPVGTTEPTATVFAWNAGFGASNAVTIPICTTSTSNDTVNDCRISGVEHEFYVKIYSALQQQLVIDVLGYYSPAP